MNARIFYPTRPIPFPRNKHTAKLGEVAHVVSRKASNTVEDIKSGDAPHIVARKAKNTVEDVKHFAGDVGDKLKPAADKAGDVAKQVRQGRKEGCLFYIEFRSV